MKKAGWDLELSLQEARENDEIVSISDSQMLRFIDELNGVSDLDAKAAEVRKEIKWYRKQPHSVKNKNQIRNLYEQLDRLQFKPDYMTLIVASKKDYIRACKGFKINGIEYTRLLATNGGVKNKTIVFVSKRLAPELRRRIDNGRDMSVKMIPAKFEAYRALTCSGSTPVSLPHGILVVNDCITHFKEDVIYLNDEDKKEPEMSYRENVDIELNCSDGFGLIHPKLAERWSEELGLDYVSAGFNTRFSFEKGMVFCFDFIKFAKEIAKSEYVVDAWGTKVNINEIELILTTSMLKLWDSYKSCNDYLVNCLSNHYTFSVTKTCPEELDKERCLNYQFIQSYKLTDEQIEELIKPTIDELKDTISGDYQKAILFLKGMYMNEENVSHLNNDFIKALMIDRRMFDDPFVRNKIYSMIKKRISDAKIGVIKVHGNYSIASGDPFSLCQSMFGMEVTGILKKGEIYNGYWRKNGSEKVACYRAPMTCHNNIKVLNVNQSDDAEEWYKHMQTVTIFNSFDTTTQALNGADFDGDLAFLTDNKVLVENTKPTKTIMCVQRKGVKVEPTEETLIQSNINSFGDEIGRTTNWITSMFQVQSQYNPNSEEYQILDYRIKCGQLYQQNSIDKAKGIIAQPMPKEWYDRGINRIYEEDNNNQIAKKELNMRIVADKKPYFMIYIYPNLMRDYKTYIKSSQMKCLRKFRIKLEDLLSKEDSLLTEEERVFRIYFYNRMPVGVGNCVMNRICKRFEEEFDSCIKQLNKEIPFDYSFLKQGVEYNSTKYRKIKDIYTKHNLALQEYCSNEHSTLLTYDDKKRSKIQKIIAFKRKCQEVCSNETELCDIVLDLCYQKKGTKQFAWDVCANTIIHNLLKVNDYTINYPVMDDEGDIVYCGHKFKMETKRLEECY